MVVSGFNVVVSDSLLLSVLSPSTVVNVDTFAGSVESYHSG